MTWPVLMLKAGGIVMTRLRLILDLMVVLNNFNRRQCDSRIPVKGMWKA
ncbi:MAG: hypothetical protein RL563_1347 [Pseudomonadota bacterium]